jgi:hypothetical protein
MKLLTQEKNLNENLLKFPMEKNIIEKIRLKEIQITDDLINNLGMSFLFLGPCDQCGEYKDKYITVIAVDDYCRSIKGLMCTDCIKKAMNLIST